MITVQTVLDYLWTLAPMEYKESWDNVGFLLGRRHTPVSGILVSLDATASVASQAKALGCQLVVTHHPVIFRGEKHITDADPLTETHLAFLENGISVICLHTNLDCAPGGVNDVLAGILGLKEVRVLEDGETAGLIRIGSVEQTTLADFAKHVKTSLQCPGLRCVDGGKPVRRVAVGGGGCADYVGRVLEAGCDTFVTADVKYHQFCDAATLGLNLIDAGHFETENPVCTVLAQRLAETFPTVQVRLAAHNDCIRFV